MEWDFECYPGMAVTDARITGYLGTIVVLLRSLLAQSYFEVLFVKRVFFFEYPRRHEDAVRYHHHQHRRHIH